MLLEQGGGHHDPLPDDMVQIAGASSSTFTAPPIDRALTLGQYVDHHMQHSPEHVVMRWHDGGKEQMQTWRQLARAVHRAAQIVTKQLAGCATDAQTCVAMFVNGDLMTYVATSLGIARAGFVAFPISINNSAEATAHLLRVQECVAVIGNVGGTAPALERVLVEALRDAPSVRRLDWIGFETLFDDDSAHFSPLPPLDNAAEQAKLDHVVVVLHSSGSTSFPKPIPIKHRAVSSYILARNYGHLDCSDTTTFMGHMPPFHAMSMMITVPMLCGWANAAGTFSPCTPPKPVDPFSTLDAAVRIHAAWLPAPPIFLQTWARVPACVEKLRQIDLVSFGGGPLSRETGAELVEKGVHLNTAYAATEIGMRAHFDLYYDRPDLWEWNQDLPIINSHFRPQQQEGEDDVGNNGAPKLYEYVVGPSPRFRPNVFNDKLDDGTPVFATNDLVELHPTLPRVFRYVGRADQQIMLSTGEKTNPTPLIGLIESNALVSGCMYFGRNKPHNGIIVEPAKGVDGSDVNAFRDSIWPEIEKANRFAPSHSYVYKDMIVVATPLKPLQRTGKGTLRWGAILADYEDEIEAAYDAFNGGETGSSSKVVPKKGTANGQSLVGNEAIAAFVRDTVRASLTRMSSNTPIDDEADLFADLGADSLVAARIRNALAARNDSLPTDFVFRNPSVRSLTSAFENAAAHSNGINGTGNGGTATNDLAERVAEMEKMIRRYSQDLPSLGQRSDERAATVVVTGTTGGLGAHLLAKLLQSKDVVRVYALNRHSSNATIVSRQAKAFKMRGCDVSLLDQSSKLTLIETDLNRPRLGLSDALYATLSDKVTAIFHVAWRLDFNLALASFEEHVRSTRTLVDLALHADAQLLFTSSIAVAMGSRPHPVLEETYVPLTESAMLGYGASKAVAERILERANEKRRLRVRNVRIGQLSGSTTNGAWATTDWMPIMIKSSIAMGCVPLAPPSSRVLTWLPTDVCADTLLDMANNVEQEPGCTRHILHPRPVAWSEVMGYVAGELRLKTTKYADWIDRLQKQAEKDDPQQAKDVPAIKLLDFFRGMETADQGESVADGVAELDCTLTLSESASLQKAEPIARESVAQWIDFWRSAEFL